MAREKGAFSKFLNILGLVEEKDEGYADDYQPYVRRPAANNRPSTYVPQQQRSRTADTRGRTVVPQNNRYAPQRNDVNEGYTVRRTDRSFDTGRTAPAAAAQPKAAPEPRRAPAPRRNVPARTQPVSSVPGTARTIMCPIATLEECTDVIAILVANNIVLVTMDMMDNHMAQRAVDTLSGAAYALNATLKKASDHTYLIAPSTVQVSETDSYRRY